MKILHIVQERDAALVAARVVRETAQNVTLTWVQTPDAALQWLRGNRDTAAVIVEVHAQSCASFIEQLRGLGLTTPVVVVAGSARLEPALAALNSGADGYVMAGPSLEADLPRTVAAAIERERGREQLLTQTLAELGAERARVEQELARAEEARRRTEQRSASELAAAAVRLADVEARHSVSLARETGIGMALQQKRLELESALRKADEQRASETVAFADQLAKRHAEFMASLAQAAQSRDALAAELSVATAALEEARQARRTDAAAAAEQLRRREAELQADAAAARTALDNALAEADAAHQDTRQRAAVDLAAANERQAALEDLLTQESDRRTGLDRKLTAAETAHQEADRRHAAELTRVAAGLADLQARYDAALEDGAAARTALERQIAEAAARLADLQALHDAALEQTAAARTAFERQTAEAAAGLADLQALHDAALEDTAAARAAFERQIAEAASVLDRQTVEAASILERQTVETASALERANQERAAEAAAAAERLAGMEADLGARLAEAVAAGAAFEATLTDAESSLRHAVQRAAEDAAAAAARQAALEERLAQELDRGMGLERQVSAAETARQETDRRHASELALAVAHLASLQTRHDTAVTEHAAARAALAERLIDTATAHQHAEDRAAAALADASAREADLVERLTKESDARAAGEQDLTGARTESARGRARTLSVISTYRRWARERKARLEAGLEERLAQETNRGSDLERQVSAAETARQETDQRHASELALAETDLASLQTRYDTAVTEHAAAHSALEQRLIEAATAHQYDEDRAAAALAAASAREADLVERLAKESDARTAGEQDLTGARMESARGRARTLSVVSTYRRWARERKARLEAGLEERLAQETNRGGDLERQLSAAETARQETDQRHASELALAETHLASLQTRYDAAVTEHAAAHSALEQRLIEAATAHQHAEDRAAAALAAASARETDLVERLAKESDARTTGEQDLTETRTESARGRARTLSVISTYRRWTREQKARFEAQLTGERADADRALRAKDEELGRTHLERETLQQRLGTTHEQLQHLHRIVDEEREAHELARVTSESELQRVSAEYGQIRQSFDRLQSAFQTLEQIAGEHAAERARLETVVADRDNQLSAQTERHRVAEQAAHDAFAQLHEKLGQTVAAGRSEIARLQQELEATWTHAEALRGVAARVPDLQTELERSRNEQRRQFERAPYALCRCSESGAIADANHSFVTLLGYRRVDELRDMGFAAAAHDSAGDLGWLLDRARTTRKTEVVEIQWKTRQGRHLLVRLQALATTGSIDIAAEDITGVRALEDRLRQAQRMEAVGRLASEVAVTCDAMLRDVARGAQEWLARGSDDALRAERLLADVARAASLLRQLEMYGQEQVRALEPVSAQRVLRDLAPVLKRLVGDQIELVLPKSAGAFTVDVDAERLERVLINVAGYARDRMSSGGQVRIDLATRAVGRRFTARYSNVRPGDHVLITVTELPAVGEVRGDSERSSQSSDKPGVDLGVLLGLIASCGGHLWLEAQPAGNMVVKIHLPKPAAATATDKGGGRLSRWFRSASAANVRASRTL